MLEGQSVYKFREILAGEEIFKQTKDKYRKELEEFEEFAEGLTIASGKAKTKSGKASSYVRYLVRLIIFSSESSKYQFENLFNFATLKEIEKVKNDLNFKEFNNQSNHFYSATLTCYRSYISYINNQTEVSNDLKLNMMLNSKISNESEEKRDRLLAKPSERKAKISQENNFSYPRSLTESLLAKRQSDWKCELNEKHETFIVDGSQKPYMEAHHLIPMGVQDYYENTIDFSDNIVSLCPTCHAKVHFGLPSEKKKMLTTLFEKRKNLYINYGIEIDKKTLLSFYSII